MRDLVMAGRRRWPEDVFFGNLGLAILMGELMARLTNDEAWIKAIDNALVKPICLGRTPPWEM